MGASGAQLSPPVCAVLDEMKICNLIDRYRDEELDERQRHLFELHLPGCSRCRFDISVLNNLVHCLDQSGRVFSPVEPQHITRQASAQTASWDHQVVSWLRPIPAWSTVIVALAVYYALGFFSPAQPK